MTPFDDPWWNVVMKIVLAFGVLAISFALATLIILTSRMLGAWRHRRRLVKLRQRRGPFQKDPRKRWPHP